MKTAQKQMLFTYMDRGRVSSSGQTWIFHRSDLGCAMFRFLIARLSVRSMLFLGGLGACPPGKFEKIDTKRWNLNIHSGNTYKFVTNIVATHASYNI